LFSEQLSLKFLAHGGFLKLSNPSTVLLLCGLLVIILLPFQGNGLIELEDQFENDDPSFLIGNLVTWGQKYPLSESSRSLYCVTFCLALLLEYVRGHIGEKQLPDAISTWNRALVFAHKFQRQHYVLVLSFCISAIIKIKSIGERF
jgi:hypothetical protein